MNNFCKYCLIRLSDQLIEYKRTYCNNNDCLDKFISETQFNMIREIEIFRLETTNKYKDILIDTNIHPCIYIDYSFVNKLKFSYNSDSDSD